jgi:DNA-binding beta-propeller fold protein YncE
VECTVLKKFTGLGEHALVEPTGVAVDSAGDVWIADDGGNRIEEFNPAGAFIGEIKSEGVRAVALDAHDDVFAVVHNGMDSCEPLEPPCDHLVEYSAAGAQLADVGAGDFGPTYVSPFVFGESFSMPAVNDQSGRVYVTDAAKNLVWMFGPPTKPQIESEVATEVGSHEAKLGALVNPGGIDSSYHFEYGTTTAYGYTVPSPEGDAGTGVRPRTVWASASELLPGTTYHYRIVVTNALGTKIGADGTFTTETAAQVSCPNEQLRTGFSSNLPDCRAYELVTPPSKGSAQPDPGSEQHQLEDNLAANDGDRMAYKAIDVFPGSQSAGEDYVATRGADGWSSENELPPEGYYRGYQCSKEGGRVVEDMYSPDLTEAIVTLGGNQVAGEGSPPGAKNEFGGGCGGPQPELVMSEPKGVENLFVRDNTEGTYQLVDVTPLGVTPTNTKFVGASADLNHVIFEERAKLVPEALNDTENLYEWDEGVVRLVTVATNGSPVSGSFAGISADGSHVFFTAEGKLYERVSGVETVQVDASQAGGSGGGGSFVAVSADGSRVFFTDEASARLTGDTVAGSGTNLYEYDLQSRELVDLTPAAKAEVQVGGAVSEDGSYVYFVAHGELTGAERQHGETAQNGELNLYVRHGGTTMFIATGGCVGDTCRRITPSGLFYLFESTKSLTGYENTDVNTGSRDPEIYLYDAATNSLTCASCNPSGEAPTSALTSGRVMTPNPRGTEVPHYLTEDGRVFFETSDALLPSDSNGQPDVYEYELDGVGSCGQTEGCLFLISTGTGPHPTRFIDASASGDDAFLLDEQALTPLSNAQEARAIYDARVGGGFPSPSSPPPCTTPESCRSAPAPQPSIFGAPASQTFSGVGNIAPPATAKPKAKPKSQPVKCKKGLVRKKGRCVKKPRRKAKKSAHANRRGK